MAEFKQSEADMDRDSFDLEQRQGKNPSRQLCRMCRKVDIIEGDSFINEKNML
jgi:hypothetical protein